MQEPSLRAKLGAEFLGPLLNGREVEGDIRLLSHAEGLLQFALSQNSNLSKCLAR